MRDATKACRGACVPVQAVDQLVVFHQAVAIEAAHGEHGFAPEAREGTRHQQQAVELRPGVARQEVADVLVGLEPLEDAAAPVLAADRGDDAGGGDQMGVLGEGLSHRSDRLGRQQGVAVHRQHDVGLHGAQGLVECAGLAAMGQAQPAQA